MFLIAAYKELPRLLFALTLGAGLILLWKGVHMEWVLDPLNGFAALFFVVLALGRLTLGAPNEEAKRIWIALICLLLVFAGTQFAGSYGERIENALGIGDMSDYALLAIGLLSLWMVRAFDPVPFISGMLLWAAFALQAGSMVVDIIQSTALAAHFPGVSAVNWERLDAAADFSQSCALQLYLAGMAVFLLSLHLSAARRATNARVIGDLSRSSFARLGLRDKLRYPPLPVNVPGIAFFMAILRLVTWVPVLGPGVRKACGKSIARQIWEIMALTFVHGMDAQVYYMFEMYRAPKMKAAAAYLTRFETKNGLFKALNQLFPVDQQRSPLGDKLLFSAFGEANQIPVVPILFTAEGGMLQARGKWASGALGDLFVKPREGKGAKGTGFYRKVSADQYLSEDGTFLSFAELSSEIAELSADRPLLVQPRLRNHPDLQDLAKNSLLIIRVITCLSDQRQPVITHGMLRVLCKLEKTWPLNIELAAPIDLATGAMGAMTADKGKMALRWFDTHPVTGARVTGRTVPCWEEIKAVALRAHAACHDRFVIGWDIACTPDGPVIVEGNSFPDVEFPQRVYRQPIGETLLGKYLLYYLRLLEGGATSLPETAAPASGGKAR